MLSHPVRTGADTTRFGASPRDRATRPLGSKEFGIDTPPVQHQRSRGKPGGPAGDPSQAPGVARRRGTPQGLRADPGRLARAGADGRIAHRSPMTENPP